MGCLKEEVSKERIRRILEGYEGDERGVERYVLESELKKNERIKLRYVELKIKNIKIV
jgi:hypothetical protein